MWFCLDIDKKTICRPVLNWRRFISASIKRLDDAEKVLNECLSISKNDLNSRNQIGEDLSAPQKTGWRRKRCWTNACLLVKTILNSRTELAKIYQRQGKLTEAEKVLMESLVRAINKKIERPGRNWRRYISGRANSQKLKKSSWICLLLTKDDLTAWDGIGEDLSAAGQTHRSWKISKGDILPLDKNGLHPRTELAKIYQRQGKLTEAEKVLMESLGDRQ